MPGHGSHRAGSRPGGWFPGQPSLRHHMDLSGDHWAWSWCDNWLNLGALPHRQLPWCSDSWLNLAPSPGLRHLPCLGPAGWGPAWHSPLSASQLLALSSPSLGAQLALAATCQIFASMELSLSEKWRWPQALLSFFHRTLLLVYVIKEIKCSQVKRFLQGCSLSATTEADMQCWIPTKLRGYHKEVQQAT